MMQSIDNFRKLSIFLLFSRELESKRFPLPLGLLRFEYFPLSPVELRFLEFSCYSRELLLPHPAPLAIDSQPQNMCHVFNSPVSEASKHILKVSQFSQ